MSVEAAFIGVDTTGATAVLKPDVAQVAFALVKPCEQILNRLEERDVPPLYAAALSHECVEAIAESLNTPEKTDTIHRQLLTDPDVETQTASYVAEEQRLFETSLRRFLVEASRWFAQAASKQWDVTLELSL